MARAIKLNRRQIDKLSDIFSDTGLVSIASVVIPAIFDRLNPFVIILGIGISIVFWLISLWLKR